MKDNYTLADILINKYHAIINYLYMKELYTITEFLYDNNLLTYKRLNYVMNKGCVITTRFLLKLIKNKDNKLYKFIYTFQNFKNDDILKFLNLYKRYRENKESLSNNDIQILNDNLKLLIHENKSRVTINEKLYKQSIDYNNNEALLINIEKRK